MPCEIWSTQEDLSIYPARLASETLASQLMEPESRLVKVLYGEGRLTLRALLQSA